MASDSDVKNLAWTMLGEAYPGDTQGMAAVGNTVLNRLNAGNYGSSISHIVKAPNQYAAWGIGSQAAAQGNNPEGRFPVGSPQFDQAYALAQAIIDGKIPDNTGGAVNYRQTGTGARWSDGAPGTISIGGNTFQTSHPVPPMNIPEVGSAYADTSVPQPKSLSSALKAIQDQTAPTYQSPFSGSGAAEQIAFDPTQTSAATPVLGADGQVYRQSGIVPPMDAGYNPATGNVQPFSNDPNILAAMGSGSTRYVPNSPGFASQSLPYYPSSVPSGPGIGQQSQSYIPSASAVPPAAGASGAVGGWDSLLASPAATSGSIPVPLAASQAKQGGVNINQGHDLNAQPVIPNAPPAGYYDTPAPPVPTASAAQTVSTPNGHTYTVGQVFTTPDGTYKVGVDANGQATFNKAPTLPTGGVVGNAITNAITSAAAPIIASAPSAISGATSGLGNLFGNLFGNGGSKPVTGSVPQTAGPAGQSYQTLGGTGVAIPTTSGSNAGGPYNYLDAIAGSSNSAVPQSYGPAGGSYSTPYGQSAQAAPDVVDPSYYTPAPVAPTYVKQINPAYTAWMNNQQYVAPVAANSSGSPDDRDSPNGVAQAVPGLTSTAFGPAPSQYIYTLAPTSQAQMLGRGVYTPTSALQNWYDGTKIGQLGSLLTGNGVSQVGGSPGSGGLLGMLAGGFGGNTSTPSQIMSLASLLTPQQQAQQNPAALAAIQAGLGSYSSGATYMPTVAMNGQIRNTYADTSSGFSSGSSTGSRPQSLGESMGF